MSNRSIRWVIFFGVLAIVAILTVQGYFFYKAFDLRERQTEQSLRISLQTVAENICKYNECTLPDNVIHQFSSSYFIVDISNHIDPWILEHYLRTELNRRHITIDFEYAIYDCNDDKMVYGNYVSLDEKETKKEKLDYWPKYEEGTYYFGVHFPGIRSYILGDMGLWYFFTIILVIVIAFFGYSMMIILRQKRLSEVQRDFINNMSHEFRTPLTSISLAADVLNEEGRGGDPVRFGKFSEILKEQIRLMQKKVDNILLQAETERSFFNLNKERFHVMAVLKEVMEEFRSRAEHPGGHIELEDTAGNPEILADRYHLAGIMINLVDNAIKYSSSPPKVVIRVTESRGKIIISVVDHGEGIDKKHHRRVFMPFFRVPSGNVHNVKGSGLGLSYVRKICDLHRWKVRLESEPGKGTTISISVPKLK
jgi:two-component system, OmpR family, phosphate regulon sensor histidine kinase PhoR